MNVLYLALTIISACAAGLLLYRLRVPGGMMIGAVIGACVLNLASGWAFMPSQAKTLAQIIAGACIGANVSREEIRGMRSVYKPAIILLPGLLIINVGAGFLIRAVSGMELLTAMFSCTPGGISDIPLIAADLGADPGIVTVMQFIRFLMGIALFPALIKLLGKRENALPVIENTNASEPKKPLGACVALLVAAALGVLGKLSGIPGGTMALATLGTMALKWFYPSAWSPKPLRRIAQLLSGAFVGAGMGMSELSALATLWLPALILIACYLLGAYGVAYCLRRAKCFDYKESMLAATPAGASDMALISADLGIHNAEIVVLQVVRLIIVISVFPSLLSLISRL